MRIVRFIDAQGQTKLGHVPLTADGSVPGNAELLDGDLFDAARPLKPTGKSAAIARLLAPFLPINIFCVGLNYREHAKEGGQPIPEAPVIFMKPTTSLTDPGAPILLPKACKGPEVDYECELAIVIGKKCRDVAEADALKYVLGYTAANDVSARHWQRNNGTQWVRGKSFDTFCPIGPTLITTDQIPDPQTLAIKTILNGQVLQNHTTADMIFSVATIVSFISQDTTLLPGTLILTGTPQGVGFARKPPVYFKDGDTVTIEVDKIGRLTNPVKTG